MRWLTLILNAVGLWMQWMVNKTNPEYVRAEEAKRRAAEEKRLSDEIVKLEAQLDAKNVEMMNESSTNKKLNLAGECNVLRYRLKQLRMDLEKAKGRDRPEV